MKTVKEIIKILESSPSQVEIEKFKLDKRKTVQKAVRKYLNNLEKLEVKLKDFQKRSQFEKNFWENGVKYIAGIDEVGRGALAGPVVCAAVVLPQDFSLLDVNDSKKLSANKRELLYRKIIKDAIDVSVSSIDNHTIDEVNVYQATRLAMKEAVLNLKVKPDQLIIDAMKIDTDINQIELIKGDSRSISVAAASIVAKVYRDHLMKFYAKIYPAYHFERNVGYGTKEHLNAIDKNGISDIHRLTYAPVKSKK